MTSRKFSPPIIEFNYQGKKYEVYNTKREQKAKLIVGKDSGGKNILGNKSEELTIKDFNKGLLTITAKVEGKETTLEYRKGMIVFSVIGLILVIVFFSWLIWNGTKVNHPCTRYSTKRRGGGKLKF